jgi:EAL domain-containing protein (putative c-di-GMP-specific phosphodiesterase class I)
MTNSTTAVSPRLTVPASRLSISDRSPLAGAAWRYRPADGGSFCSPAGCRRPWLERLRRALRGGLFELHYQPIVALATGEVSHYEALVRLADEPDGRLIAPGEFLPTAERYGLVRAIDRLVVERVAALLGTPASQDPYVLQDARAPQWALASERNHAVPGACAPAGTRVAINVSALSATDEGMLSHIERQLAHHGVDPTRLVVEITETAAISDMDRARDFCEGLEALGCAVALDDFGVGFGSFYYAKRLPFRYLKIDGDFIRGLCENATDRIMVSAIVEVARGMGRATIAEFVGDEPTMELLRELGVDYAQGFHVGRPRPLVAG